MSDPLDLLRESIASSRLPTLLTAADEPTDSLSLAAYLSFPSERVAKDAVSRYARSAARTDFYTVGQLWLAYVERETGVREYLVKGQALGSGYVAITDRRGVVEFLQGEGDGAGRVVPKGQDLTAPSTTAASAVAESLPSALESGEAGPSRAPKRKYEVDVVDREFCKKIRSDVIELRDRNTVLRATAHGKVNNFSSFLSTVMTDKIRALRRTFETTSSARAPPAPAAVADPARPRKAKSTNPIIMISSSPTALLTMWNVKKFLEQGIFEPSDVARQNEAAQGNFRAEDMIPVLRKRSGPNGDITSKYYVVDGVEALQKFGTDAWDRVICVVTTGQAWQFKPYKWMEPRTLFRNVKGVYFQWHNEPTNPAIRDWNVTPLTVDRHKRHTDRQVVTEFWRVLDKA